MVLDLTVIRDSSQCSECFLEGFSCRWRLFGQSFTTPPSRTLLGAKGIATRSKDAPMGLLALLLGTMFAIRNTTVKKQGFAHALSFFVTTIRARGFL